MANSTVQEFSNKGMKVQLVDFEAVSYWTKLKIFQKGVRLAYDRVLYMDADVAIQKNIQPLFDQEGEFLADRDARALTEEFMPGSVEWVDKDYEAFCSGFLRYDTEFVKDDVIEKFELLIERYGAANKMFDQGILNLFFYKKWKPFDRECFWGCRNTETVACHCTRWYAPWDQTGSQAPELYPRYLECLQYFKDVM
jgi:alpha-N-acetylglucosamine transferase